MHTRRQSCCPYLLVFVTALALLSSVHCTVVSNVWKLPLTTTLTSQEAVVLSDVEAGVQDRGWEPDVLQSVVANHHTDKPTTTTTTTSTTTVPKRRAQRPSSRCRWAVWRTTRHRSESQSSSRLLYMCVGEGRGG